MHPHVERTVRRHLSQIDQLLPGWVVGFYVVGSTALGAYRHGRSDVDFVAVVSHDPDPGEIRRLRLQHLRSAFHTGGTALAERRSPLAGTCNGVFIREDDLRRPVTDIVAVAGHTGHVFKLRTTGSDVSPVAWKVLRERGIPMRGPRPSALGLDPQAELLAAWNIGNLESYWRPWASAVKQAPAARFRLRPRYLTAWGALGAPRLHHTIATGEVISKEAAGEYALDVFAPRWRRLIDDALAYWHGDRDLLRLSPGDRGQLTSDFVLDVIESAHQLPAAVTAGSNRPAR